MRIVGGRGVSCSQCGKVLPGLCQLEEEGPTPSRGCALLPSAGRSVQRSLYDACVGRTAGLEGAPSRVSLVLARVVFPPWPTVCALAPERPLAVQPDPHPGVSGLQLPGWRHRRGHTTHQCPDPAAHRGAGDQRPPAAGRHVVRACGGGGGGGPWVPSQVIKSVGD